MFDVAYREFGDVDIVCPGSGVYEPHWSNFWCPPGSKQSRDAVDSGSYALLDINLTHPLRTTQLAISNWLHPRELPHSSPFPRPAKVSATNRKRVIHIASVASYLPVSGQRCTGLRNSLLRDSCVPSRLWNNDMASASTPWRRGLDAWVTPEEVAEAMLSCVEDEDKRAGLLLEVGSGRTREVATFNDPGPDSVPEAGIMTRNSTVGDDEVHGFLESSTVWSRPSKL
ncbi:unnamed protein product [Clonostachys chloroleuca]|uniref:Uncharacterized protein n=1 Tax=Clonostachys chloroleuca TaxID=1926264 RepID=A0AA35LSQ4_9HYPO|nr:unnamed protein product [Clonostachys chloroleuca]